MVTRTEWEAKEDAGLCPECGTKPCAKFCRKFWFDYGFRVGYHDGANNLQRHDHAFLVELIERDEVDNDQ
jgi:hypothetical protein